MQIKDSSVCGPRKSIKDAWCGVYAPACPCPTDGRRAADGHDLGDRNKELMAAYPGRAYFRGTYDRDRHQPQLEMIPTVEGAF